MRNIKLQSRYKDVETYYNPIDKNSGVILSNGQYVRRILDSSQTKIEAIDFEGGPMLNVGDELEGTNKKIKSIRIGYYVELE